MNALEEKTNKTRPHEAVTLYFNKMKGATRSQAGFDYIDSLISAVGVFLAVSVVCFMAFSIHYPMVIVLMIMSITKTMHPPAAASALVAVNFETGWGILLPIVIGVIFIVFISMFYNNLFPKRQYPQYWIWGRNNLLGSRLFFLFSTDFLVVEYFRNLMPSLKLPLYY